MISTITLYILIKRSDTTPFQIYHHRTAPANATIHDAIRAFRPNPAENHWWKYWFVVALGGGGETGGLDDNIPSQLALLCFSLFLFCYWCDDTLVWFLSSYQVLVELLLVDKWQGPYRYMTSWDYFASVWHPSMSPTGIPARTNQKPKQQQQHIWFNPII